MSVIEPPSLKVARSVVRALISSGATEFAYCPGSRNAPFAYVLAAEEAAGRVNAHTFAEERGAGYWALGAAQALGGRVPVAVITTSGTAVAELHPALEEARHQGLPVIAVTADRPFDMVGVGASQATHRPACSLQLSAPEWIFHRALTLQGSATVCGGRWLADLAWEDVAVPST